MPKPTRLDVERTVATMADALILMDVSFNALGETEQKRLDAHKSVLDHPGPFMLQKLAGMLDGIDDMGKSVRKYLPAMLTVAKSTAEAYAAIAPAGSEFAKWAAQAAAHADQGLALFPAKDDDPYMVYDISFGNEDDDDDSTSESSAFDAKWDVGRTFDELNEELKRILRF